MPKKISGFVKASRDRRRALNISESDFKDLVFKELEMRGVSFSMDGQSLLPLIPQKFFFDLTRSTGSHRPDCFICLPDKAKLPCELKSPSELYQAGRYSQAHLLSYLLQTIWGQLLSYADIFRRKDINEISGSTLSIFILMGRFIVFPGSQSLDLVKFLPHAFVSFDVYSIVMQVRNIKFKFPYFSDEINPNFGLIGDKIIGAQITYEL